jgi:hypothetical protein
MLTISFSLTVSVITPAKENAKSIDEETDELKPELRVHIMYEENFAKPDNPGGGNGGGKKDKGGPDCYDFISRGAKWKSTNMNIVVDDDTPAGISQQDFIDQIQAGAEEWDDATSYELLGTVTGITDGTLDRTIRDGRNEMVFGDYDAGVIAVCYTWGYYNGPPSQRYLVEFDILFNTDYPWSLNGAPNAMDLLNIGTHELGHGWGLADVYEDECSDVTMYGIGAYGETKKQTLEQQDITGLQEMYGE